jgi:hypothetical protein
MMLHPTVAMDLAEQRLAELRAETRRSGLARAHRERTRRTRRLHRTKLAAARVS